MLTLALGIGARSSMVDVLDRLLLRAPTQVTDPDRVARVYFGSRNGSYVGDLTDYATFEALSAMRDTSGRSRCTSVSR